MRQSDHDRLLRRLAELETRTTATSGARDRLAERLAAMHEVLPPMPAHEARAALLARLDTMPDDFALAALRRAVARHV